MGSLRDPLSGMDKAIKVAHHVDLMGPDATSLIQ